MDVFTSACAVAGVQDGSAPLFRHLGRRKAYEQVGEEIRAQILAGRLKVDQRLPTERDLAVQFGVSRVVVREAVRSLELTGLLSVKKGPRGGIFVARDYARPINDSIANLLAVGEADLKDLFEVRKLIEPYAAARVARIATEADLELLSRLVGEAEAGHRLGKSIRELNIELHRRIIDMSGNPVLGAVGKTVLVLLANRLKPVADQSASAVALASHRKLLAAFRARDPESARSIMSKDIESVGRSFSRLGEAPSPRTTGRGKSRMKQRPGPRAAGS